MVAAVCAWHEHHDAAETEIGNRLRDRQRLLVAAPAVTEAYSVLTRLPPPHRLSPADALTLLDANFIRPGRMVALTASGYRALLRRAPEEGLAGGRVYDAVIARCALKANSAALLTFNAAHFASFAELGLEIVVPGGS